MGSFFKGLIYNGLNSLVTSSVGAIIGVPQFWEGIKGLLDDDPTTGIIWKTLFTGIGIIFAGLMTRDHTKNWTDKLVKAPS